MIFECLSISLFRLYLLKNDLQSVKSSIQFVQVSTLGEEKVALQLRLDEREMQLESAKFSLEALQLTNGNEANRLEVERKNYRVENDDIYVLSCPSLSMLDCCN